MAHRRLLSQERNPPERTLIINKPFSPFKSPAAAPVSFAALRVYSCSFARAHYNGGHLNDFRSRSEFLERRGWKATGFMARPKTSVLRRILVQTDCSFWCIHDHLDVLAYLGLPTLAALVTSSLVLVGVWRTWEFPVALNIVLVGLVVPFLALVVFTAFPLPCAVFAWKAASGETATVGECFSFCWRRAGRLLSVLVRLSLLWIFSLLLFGLPLVAIWPKTCLAPLVALFEDERRIFRRSGRIIREDFGVPLMGFLYLGMGIVLGGLVALPRLLVGTNALGAQILDASWRPALLDRLWIFETMSVAFLLTAIAMSWWISLTLVYHDIRWVREGEDLRRRIARVRGKLGGLPAFAAGAPGPGKEPHA
jgi:hypothetical protein